MGNVKVPGSATGPPHKTTDIGESHRQVERLWQSTSCHPVTMLAGEEMGVWLPGLRRGRHLWDRNFRRQPQGLRATGPFTLLVTVIKSQARGVRG